ncbi:hypothetical protein [Aquimarina mytili]|uniref:Fibronectin type-III domain-containing protein n=1 Tax=Aquimarina mytili TaxID=874423 RepID=A0A936ZPV6_9FLAO|nr:hypothetical protein [Aquimarina mytili]MBL0683534.1 hypothetical protein [Aquimarina mytili]
MKKLIFLFSLIILLPNCSSDSDESGNEQQTTQNPTASKLIFPFENSLCNVGTNITSTESTVLFEWESSANTDSYELELTNLTTGDTSIHQSTETQTPIVLSRGTPYSWYVISKSNAITETAQSAIWKFYNAGDAIESYAPFPAEAISPAMAESVRVTTNELILDWRGTDVDDDIVGYDLYFDTTATPEIIANDIEESTFSVSIASNTIYYWKIITKDSRGNTSDSGLFQFKIL